MRPTAGKIRLAAHRDEALERTADIEGDGSAVSSRAAPPSEEECTVRRMGKHLRASDC